MPQELKPPQELVDAIQASEDMTAPADHGASAMASNNHNTPHSIRARLAHEHMASPPAGDAIATAGAHDKQAVAVALGLSLNQQNLDKAALKDHMREVQAMHGKGGVGSGGNHIKGSAAAGQSKESSDSRLGGRESYTSSHRGSHLM